MPQPISRKELIRRLRNLGFRGPSLDKQATVRVCAYRRAERREQPDVVTNRMMAIMTGGNNGVHSRAGTVT